MRNLKLYRAALFVASLTLGLAACSGENDTSNQTPGGKQADRVKLGKADSLSGSCSAGDGTSNFCEGKSNGACWCDEACSQYGDCCVDYKTFCEAPNCPDPSDAKVRYINNSYKNPLACTNILFACEPGETAFSDACGCGCIAEESPSCPDPNDAAVHYVNDSYQQPIKCSNILFTCEPGQSHFSNDCGCGCIDPKTPPSCPDPNDPLVTYMAGSENDPSKCATILFTCEPNDKVFYDECGCGCIGQAAPAPSCPDASDPKVTYVNQSEGDPSQCLNILFACEPGEKMFSDDCGCGCIAP